MARVLIVDDSSTYRMILRRVLSEDSSLDVVGTSRDGKGCLDAIDNLRPDLITLDQVMPGMDGLETLKNIKERYPDRSSRPKVIMISSLSKEAANITMESLRLGAVDFITKPQKSSSDDNIATLKRDLLPKIRSIFSASSSKVSSPKSSPSPPQPSLSKPLHRQQYELIVIGCSTGGPQALAKLLPKICKLTELPILIVQHMPPMFTRSLANSLDTACDHNVIEAQGGEKVLDKTVYIAPGGRHMVVQKSSGSLSISTNEDPPENHCRPAVDVMFRSVAKEFKGKVMTLILTGMGSDGSEAIADLKKNGATVLVQDEESSVVWGMPGSAVATGNVDGVFSLRDLPIKIGSMLG